ncbi:hypothetical protein [Bacteroides finegoldii]|jgi:hypothetical protein|uniref:hypothetical protein n=1 Tax=Bacteroides finegoldii TaxID=338188 RepID=UPI00189CEE3D|nr:hypothetical protein [Bacteroides finegoldii]MDC7141182.1 hypothetical protein [Bacteroides finegoldii]DAO13769.1 MAG TPA: hypothetical protein [Caudoviricetes sp.]
MDKKELVKFLRDYNHWRRGAEIPMPSPKELGIALDIAISIIEKIEEKVVNKNKRCLLKVSIFIRVKYHFPRVLFM